MKCDQIIKLADILCINETHLSTTDQLQCDMLNLEQDMEIYRKDRNNNGGGVAVLIHKNSKPQEVSIETTCELVAVKISAPQDIILNICLLTTIIFNLYIFQRNGSNHQVILRY